MRYQKKIMKMGELEKLGFPRSYLIRAYQAPKQTFAWRLNPHNRTSPIIFDTDGLEKWRLQEIAAQAQVRRGKDGVF